MLKRAFDVPQMEEYELREFIKTRCESNIDPHDLASMNRQELIDHIVDNGFPLFMHLHSECQVDNNNPIFEHLETEEEREEFLQRCANQ